MLRRPLSLLALLGCTSFGTPVAAHPDKLPVVLEVFESSADPDQLWARGTFGIFRSVDGGGHWSWLCGRPFEYDVLTEDPAMAITGAGDLTVGVFRGLSTSVEGGCDARFAEEIGPRFVIDLAGERGRPSRELALISMRVGNDDFANEIWETTNDGATWAQLGEAMERSHLGQTVEPAPSDPRRIYATSHRSPTSDEGFAASLHRSFDGGESWSAVEIPGGGTDAVPFIVEVSPTRPDELWVRLDAAEEDVLLRSTDAGASWTVIERVAAEIWDVRYSPDASEVLVAIGRGITTRRGIDPYDDDETSFGIWRSASDVIGLERRFDGSVMCLEWTNRGLYGCMLSYERGYDLGLSRDDGRTFEPIMKLRQVSAPLGCGLDTPGGDLCPGEIGDLCELLNACEEAPVEPPELAPPVEDDGLVKGCACRALGGARESRRPLVSASALLAAALLRRRRRRRPS